MITAVGHQKANGAYYTPEAVARTLVRWVVRQADDRLLDPSCGDGRFLEHHANSVGVEFDPAAAVVATRRGFLGKPRANSEITPKTQNRNAIQSPYPATIKVPGGAIR